MRTRLLLACVVLAGCLSCSKPADQTTTEGTDQAQGDHPGKVVTVAPPGAPLHGPGGGPGTIQEQSPAAALGPAPQPPDDPAADCLRNMKQLAVGLLMLTSDNDDLLKVTAADWKAQAMPYIKNESCFHCPADKGGGQSYSFNPQLAGIRTTLVNNPAGTVMLYEGKDEKLDFRHGGLACVAFSDAHCRLVSEADAAKLNWKP